mgnify:CR=1 FL=1
MCREHTQGNLQETRLIQECRALQMVHLFVYFQTISKKANNTVDKLEIGLVDQLKTEKFEVKLVCRAKLPQIHFARFQEETWLSGHR